jgi:hypothetical protein
VPGLKGALWTARRSVRAGEVATGLAAVAGSGLSAALRGMSSADVLAAVDGFRVEAGSTESRDRTTARRQYVESCQLRGEAPYPATVANVVAHLLDRMAAGVNSSTMGGRVSNLRCGLRLTGQWMSAEDDARLSETYPALLTAQPLDVDHTPRLTLAQLLELRRTRPDTVEGKAVWAYYAVSNGTQLRPADVYKLTFGNSRLDPELGLLSRARFTKPRKSSSEPEAHVAPHLPYAARFGSLCASAALRELHPAYTAEWHTQSPYCDWPLVPKVRRGSCTAEPLTAAWLRPRMQAAQRAAGIALPVHLKTGRTSGTSMYSSEFHFEEDLLNQNGHWGTSSSARQNRQGNVSTYRRIEPEELARKMHRVLRDVAPKLDAPGGGAAPRRAALTFCCGSASYL